VNGPAFYFAIEDVKPEMAARILRPGAKPQATRPDPVAGRRRPIGGPQPRGKSVQSNTKMGLAALVLGLVFALVLVESIPRLLPGLMPAKVRTVQRLYEARNSWEDMMRGDPELGFVLKPGLDLRFPSEGREIELRTVEFAGHDIGFRDIGTDAPYDAIALGDSFTFCDDAPAQSCWVRVLSDMTGMSIATLGVNGYSNLAEARLFAKVGPQLAPRVVLVGFFQNDFKDNLHFHNWTQSDTDDYWTWMRRKRRSDVSEFLARNSFLYRLFDAARRYGKRDTYEYKQDGLEFVFRADGWWRTVLDQPGDTPGFHLTVDAFRQMKATAAAIDTQLVVLLFPFKEQVYWNIARQYQIGGDEIEQEDMDAPLHAVRTALQAEGIRYCDLTDDLRARALEGRQLYLKVGAHWTDDGNRAAAESIARCLGDLGIAGLSDNRVAARAQP
jgi:hypothetical protein